MKYFIFIVLSLVFSSSASAALTTVPLRQVWALSTDDVVSVNTSTRIATATAYVPNASGTIYRIKATATGARLVTAVEEGVAGGRLNPWITGALVAANLSYVGYQWYKETHQFVPVETGTCSYLPLGASGKDVSLSICQDMAVKEIESKKYTDSAGVTHHNDDASTSVSLISTSGQLHAYKVFITYARAEWAPGYPNFGYSAAETSFMWNGSKITQADEVTKNPVSDSDVESELLSSLSNQSSRQAFGDGNQPYPLDGLFTDSDLSVDPTYAPQADITTDNIKDFIDKYNTGSLQTSDPSADNYVTPSQYQYIKSQAEQAAATAAGGSTSTNPLEGMEQPITQKQYDESNLKTVEAEAAALTATKPALQTVLDKFNADKQFMVDQIAKPTAPPVAMPDFFGWAWPTGSCSGFELDFNIHVPFIGVLSIHKVVNEYCKPYTDYVHPVFFWFFNLSTLFYIFRLWDRTAIDVAKI